MGVPALQPKWVAAEPSPEAPPSPELLEFLAGSERVGQEWVDPVVFDEWVSVDAQHPPTNNADEQADDK